MIPGSEGTSVVCLIKNLGKPSVMASRRLGPEGLVFEASLCYIMSLRMTCAAQQGHD